jgi:hypothetical protein
MKTAEQKLKDKFSKIILGELEDGSKYYLGQDSEFELNQCVNIALEFASQRPELTDEQKGYPKEFVEWLLKMKVERLGRVTEQYDSIESAYEYWKTGIKDKS